MEKRTANNKFIINLSLSQVWGRNFFVSHFFGKICSAVLKVYSRTGEEEQEEKEKKKKKKEKKKNCLLYTSPSPRDRQKSRMPSSA